VLQNRPIRDTAGAAENNPLLKLRAVFYRAVTTNSIEKSLLHQNRFAINIIKTFNSLL